MKTKKFYEPIYIHFNKLECLDVILSSAGGGDSFWLIERDEDETPIIFG